MVKNILQYKDSNPKSPYYGLYGSYRDIKRRCYNQNYKGYKYWGARGIKMCDEWLNDYNSFRSWAIING